MSYSQFGVKIDNGMEGSSFATREWSARHTCRVFDTRAAFPALCRRLPSFFEVVLGLHKVFYKFHSSRAFTIQHRPDIWWQMRIGKWYMVRIYLIYFDVLCDVPCEKSALTLASYA